MRYGDDPQVVELAGYLATAIRQAIERELKIPFTQSVASHLDGYIIRYEADVPDANPPRKWAAELRGSYANLIESAAGMSAEAVVGAEAYIILENWRRDNVPTGNGVDHESRLGL